jgi:signal transduction histidine kinase
MKLQPPSGADAPDAEAAHSRWEAQKAESLVRMATGVAHDFNNHLASILGNNELLLQGLPPDSPLREHARQIENSGRLALALTQQILMFTGRIKLKLEPVRLNSLLEALEPQLRKRLPANVALELRLAPDLPETRADRERLGLALHLLVANAAEALLDRTGTITLATAEEPCPPEPRAGLWVGAPLAPDRHLALTVTDDGGGMSPEVQARIFDPFFTTRIRAQGMGLPVALGIVRAHRGAIGVESAPGQGSRFRILIPLTAGKR